MQSVLDQTKIIPGRGGIRAPYDRVINPKGDWGYLIGSARDNGGGSRHLLNFVGTRAGFEDKKGVNIFSDMRTLMERNAYDNRKDVGVFKCWSDLWGKHEGETLVFASCGPSLTQSLPALYRHRSKYRLMTVNRSHRAFQDPEVKPDYHYFVERRGLPDWIYETETPESPPEELLDMKGVTLIGTPQCDPRVVRLFEPRRRYWGYTSLGSLPDGDIQQLESFDCKAWTTAGNAPYIAMKMGFKRFICVGCDFALDCKVEWDEVDGEIKFKPMPRRMYFDRMWNHTHYNSDPQFVSKQSSIVGINGYACMADAQMIGYRDYFQAVLDIVQYEGGMECINASPRGALVWNNRDLEEALCE